MKKAMFGLLLVLCSVNAQAAGEGISAFNQDRTVRAAIDQAVRALRQQTGNRVRVDVESIGEVTLSSSCGIGGCTSTTLVTAVVVANSSNAPTRIVAARVDVNGVAAVQSRVRVLNANQMAALFRAIQ